MYHKLLPAQKDPLGTMMLDYFHGSKDAYVEVESNSLEMVIMDGAIMFRTFNEMVHLEQTALSLCKGSTLDVGAGSGCHSLYLQHNNLAVDALEISPGCVAVMKERLVKTVFHQNLFELQNLKYDTVLMLMNGLGICGTLDGLNLFLQFARTLLTDGGQILADSTDLTTMLDQSLEPDPGDGYFGETEFVMRYNEIVSDPFPWLYVDYATLKHLAEYNGWCCERILQSDDNRYLARLS